MSNEDIILLYAKWQNSNFACGTSFGGRSLGTYEQVEVIRPFIAMNKAEIAKRGQELGVDFSQTWSCYKGVDVHCGKCGTCVERREAFILAGIKDPTVYKETKPLPQKPIG